MNPADAVDTFHTITDKGPWALAVFLVLVNIGTSYALFRFFTGQLDSKDVIIKSFSEAWDRQTAAFNRRTKSDNARTEMEALQFAARTDIHPEMKMAANQIIQKTKDQNEEDDIRPLR